MSQFVTYTHRDGRLRLYDGTTNPSPYYLELPFVNADFKGAIGRPRPVQTARLDRGRLSSKMHYIEGPDEPQMSAVPITFSFLLGNAEPLLLKFKQVLNTDFAAAWTVGSGGSAQPWISTKGTTQVLGGGGSPALWTTPTFTNSPRNRCVNVECLWVDPTLGGGDTGFKWSEVWFPPDKQQISDGAEEVPISVSGDCYGEIKGIVAFTTGVSAG